MGVLHLLRGFGVPAARPTLTNAGSGASRLGARRAELIASDRDMAPPQITVRKRGRMHSSADPRASGGRTPPQKARITIEIGRRNRLSAEIRCIRGTVDFGGSGLQRSEGFMNPLRAQPLRGRRMAHLGRQTAGRDANGDIAIAQNLESRTKTCSTKNADNVDELAEAILESGKLGLARAEGYGGLALRAPIQQQEAAVRPYEINLV